MNNLTTLLVAASFAAVAFAASASAQETQDTGRYQLYQSAIEGAEQNSPVLLDTQYGRTWMLVPYEDGFAWRRIQILRLGTLGKDMLSQPNPARQGPTPAAPAPAPAK